ncbi:integrating conjugative element protein [Azoarcus communis]|jgi:integrating conjugative element protein (TIGR03765 family)|uniref:integrating conjugative element protein n=1 Tax=Parazoarcus communis TaxID=41977 RepID=UPI0014595112|nr:integrating conjugative element protein [Parazoarcus communis]NMG50483.1 integrating conjugative element protein [Parazoarcus communis]
MNRILLAATIGLLAAATASVQAASVQAASEPLIVVEDRGGVSALPHYQALNPQDSDRTTPPVPGPAPRVGSAADAEAAMLPVRSVRLSPGDEPRRVIRAPGLTPLFLVGDDDRSRAWLRQRRAALQELRAVGLVVNVASPDALAALRRLAPGLTLSPASGDDLAQRLGIRHYPVLITATGIEP